mgnify:CR=1
ITDHDDDDNNFFDFKKINNNKPSYNNTQEPYVDYNNNEYEDEINLQNSYSNNMKAVTDMIKYNSIPITNLQM